MFQYIDNENITCFDIDETLLIWNIPEDRKAQVISFDCFGFPCDVVPHFKHIELLKQFKARGHFVIVWSQGGAEFARATVEKLGLEKFVDIAMAKPKWIVDDKPAAEWTSRTYLDLNGKSLKKPGEA